VAEEKRVKEHCNRAAANRSKEKPKPDDVKMQKLYPNKGARPPKNKRKASSEVEDGEKQPPVRTSARANKTISHFRDTLEGYEGYHLG